MVVPVEDVENDVAKKSLESENPPPNGIQMPLTLYVLMHVIGLLLM